MKTPILAAKRRTITLTNRAPINIIEDDWPVIAQGICGEEYDASYPCHWTIEIRVRLYSGSLYSNVGRAIIHVNYEYYDEIKEDGQRVRVGRILNVGDDLWKNILEVGEELRERISHEFMRKYVAPTLDACFAKLPPHSL